MKHLQLGSCTWLRKWGIWGQKAVRRHGINYLENTDALVYWLEESIQELQVARALGGRQAWRELRGLEAPSLLLWMMFLSCWIAYRFGTTSVQNLNQAQSKRFQDILPCSLIFVSWPGHDPRQAGEHLASLPIVRVREDTV